MALGRRAALALAILAPVVCAGWRAGTVEAASGVVAAVLAPALDAAGVRIASAAPAAADPGGRPGEAPAAHTRGSRLTVAGPESPETFLATPGITLEPVSEREGPQARMRVRGLRIIRGAPPIRLALKPDAPRVRHREQAHLNALPALVRARAGILPSRSTSLPPPSHSS